MKKIFILLICISIIFCASCGKNNITETTPPLAESTNNTISEYDPMSVDSVYIDDYKEYLDYVDEYAKEDFISYDQISFIGEFKDLVLLTDEQNFDRYMYTFIDENGNIIYLKVYHDYTKESWWKDENTSKDIIPIPSGGNFVKRNHDKSGFMTVGNLNYNYVCGEINCIFWTSGNYGFVLSSKDYFDYYTLGEKETFLHDILLLDTAVPSMEKFNAAVATK